MLCRLPNIRLGEALEFLEEVLDSTLTAATTCDQDMLAILIWLLTRMRPNLMISDLRCERYIDLYLRLRAASNRIKQCNAHDYNEVLSKLKLCHLDPTDVVEIAVTRGFEQHWLERKKKDTKMQGTKRQIMQMLNPVSPAPGPQAPLALEMGAARAPLALPAPSTDPVQPRAEALQQEEQLLPNEVSNLKDQLARATKRQRLGRYETPPGGPAREAVCPVEPVPAEVPAEGEGQGVAPASELASAPESEGPVDPGAPVGVETGEGEGKAPAPEGPVDPGAPAGGAETGEEEGEEPAPEGPVDPGAPAEVETPLAPELESVQCVLCHENFKLTDAGLLKMPHCTHTWHAECIRRYMEVTGKPLEAAAAASARQRQQQRQLR